MRNPIFIALFCLTQSLISAQNSTPAKPRVLISTDIGGTDPDDNQSMAHLLMYSDLFQLEGLVSSPSYGEGNKEEILRMIDLYEKDLPKLRKHNKNLAKPKYLRSITKQGRKGNAPYQGFSTSTEGSDWIIKCAKKECTQPLWVLGWGGLEDIAQALHDAPEIQDKIKIYWIGGPNKKWSANSYAYIAENFPNLFFIEVNSSYYGFFSNTTEIDQVNNSNYYDTVIKGAGNLGLDFKKYYNGEIKMGDSPSLFYLMDGNPDNPERDSWGGSFEKINHSPRLIYNQTTSVKDSVAFCSIIEMHLKGPKSNFTSDDVCFQMEIPYGNATQKWPGYYLGNGDYAIRYIPKKAENLNYIFTSEIPEINGLKGSLVVTNLWPGTKHSTDYPLGNNWYSDKSNPELYDGKIQGGKTVSKWRKAILDDWAKRWNWLK
ncbi:nucleoside hydrolase-like domain-containing protein [Flavobacterium daejeonense]|uniref:nucleoside hydrolase-like domain-containing protein n=1 Tax=Flavobacterium daejeonense TaxID=350893 RepID=UPI00047A028F|nr:nucleoside hydrolase-like domain-containing protein [Flavobacterium daejeonense]